MQDLIVRSLMGRTTEAEERTLELWRRAAPANESEYQALAQAWRAMSGAERSGQRPPRPRSAAEIIAAAERQPTPVERSVIGRRLIVRVAATAAAVLALVIGLQRFVPPGDDTLEVKTGLAEMVTVQLPDQSHVRLAPSTTLRYSVDDPRAAWLSGRGYFGIVSDASRPFRLRTPSGDAIVFGTRFEVIADTAQLRLVVIEGRVALETAGGRTEVSAGEVSRVIAGRPIVERHHDVQALLEWLGDVFIFQATPLEDVAHELERRFGRTVIVADGELAARKVSAVFGSQSLEQIADIVCRVTDATCLIAADTIRIVP